MLMFDLPYGNIKIIKKYRYPWQQW